MYMGLLRGVMEHHIFNSVHAIKFKQFFQVSDIIILSNRAIEFKQFFQVSDIISLSNRIPLSLPSVRRNKFKQLCHWV